ncbi:MULTISPECIES: LysR family transcriptional regulator [unclassified Pseudofrankia]|uniref:LysR family transcriptional regulator n=1 Tax=unclassified Pseudofrankia TaxID=2994372 RepID=UPI0008D92156|nr:MULTISPECIES: LysR family transcriptional regulator [unclassified Pseudofrankia]MDT3444531.1 LysR family transcriptional regulator [Pseudofrankia sp. BMG5.37]OHV56405.1 LysR family transcriptional regulator [Pseudofrankia sp. BMG5.36]
MDLQVLRWFQAVADGATVTDTADRAHLTQPGLSRALARLEREVGTPLLTRVGRGLRLTPAGRMFKAHVDQALDHYDLGLRSVADLVDPNRGVVPLAFLHTLGSWLVPPLVGGFRGSYPLIRFELHEQGEAGLLGMLLDAGVDLVFTSDDPVHPQVCWRRLLIEPLRLVVPERHRLAGRKRIRLAEIAGEAFILPRKGYGLRTHTERLCREAGFTPRVAFEGEDVDTLRALVTAGLGVALLPPSRTPHSTADGIQVSLPHLHITDVDCTRDIGLAWLLDRLLPPASASFREHVLRSTPTVTPSSYLTQRTADVPAPRPAQEAKV